MSVNTFPLQVFGFGVSLSAILYITVIVNFQGDENSTTFLIKYVVIFYLFKLEEIEKNSSPLSISELCILKLLRTDRKKEKTKCS